MTTPCPAAEPFPAWLPLVKSRPGNHPHARIGRLLYPDEVADAQLHRRLPG